MQIITLFGPSLRHVALEYAAESPIETVTTELPEKLEQSTNGAHQNPSVKRHTSPSLRLSEIIALYTEEQFRGGNWTRKTQQEYESACGLLKSIIADLPVSEISHQTIQQFKQSLMRLPAQMARLT